MSILTIEWLHLLARLTKPFANSVIYLQIKFLNPLITRKPKLRRQRKIFRQQGEIFWYPMTFSHASCSTLTINVWRNTLSFFTTRQNAETWPDEHKCGYMGKVLYNATSFCNWNIFINMVAFWNLTSSSQALEEKYQSEECQRSGEIREWTKLR